MSFLDFIPVVGDVVSAIGNVVSTSSTNKANKQIAHMNNEFNERMLQKQMDYNTDMWNKENEFNSAIQQRERLEKAGLNPYMMMNGGNAGTAGSVGGVNPPTASPVTMQAPQIPQFGASIAQAMALQEQKRVNDAQIDHVRADARLKGIQQMTTLMDAYANARTSKARSALDDTIRETNKMMQGINYKNAEADLKQKEVNSLLLSKELSIFDERFRVQMSNVIADTLDKTARMNFTKSQMIHEIYKILHQQTVTEGKKIENDILQKSAKAIVEGRIQSTLPSIGKYGKNIGDWTSSREYGSYPE